MSLGDFVERVRHHRATQVWVGLMTVTVILCFTFMIIQFVLVGESDQKKLYAIEWTNRDRLQFPDIAICPFSEQVNPLIPPTITRISCDYFHETQNPANVSITPEKYKVEDFFNHDEPTDCYRVSASRFAVQNLKDLVLCAVTTNYSIWWSPIPYHNNQPSNRWFDWNILTQLEATAFGVTATYFFEDDNERLEYQVTKVQKEVRTYTPGTGLTLFTLQFTSNLVSYYHGYHAYSFWTALGVIGGFFLLMYLITLAVWYGIVLAFRMDTSEYQEFARDNTVA